MLRTFTMALALLVCSACGDPAAEQRHEVANEAQVEISDAELADLTQRADAGDLTAIKTLINFYYVNHGDQNPDGIYWELQAARRGDCEHWRDLMFMEESGFAVPRSFLAEGETLTAIGAAHGCPPYVPQLR